MKNRLIQHKTGKLFLLTLPILFSQLAGEARADYRDLGNPSGLIALGNPSKCSYRAVFRSQLDTGSEQLRISLASTRVLNGRLQSVKGALTTEQAMDLEDRGFFTLYSSTQAAINANPKERVVSGQIAIEAPGYFQSETQVASVDLATLNVDTGLISISRYALSTASMTIEEECSQRSAGAVTIYNRRPGRR